MEKAGCLSVYLLHRLASHKDLLQGGHLSDSVQVIRTKHGSNLVKNSTNFPVIAWITLNFYPTNVENMVSC